MELRQVKMLVCLIGLSFTIGNAVAKIHISSACNGHSSNGGDCVRHTLQCEPGTSVFVVEALRFFDDRRTGNCPVQNPNCNAFKHCCTRRDEDCFKSYSEEHFEKFFTGWHCWNKSQCSFAVPSYFSEVCSSTGSMIGSGYSEISYACIADSQVTRFRRNSAREGDAIALQYKSDSSSEENSPSWHCLVEAANCSRQSAGVTMVMMENEDNFNQQCTSFGVNWNAWLPCHSSKTRLETLANIATPFTATLRVNKDNDCNEGWLVVYTQDSSLLRVTCGASQSVTPTCEPETTPTFTLPTTPTTADTTAATTAATSSATNTGIASTETAAERGHGNEAGSSNTGTVVGGVVGTLVAVVAVILVICFFMKRRGALSEPTLSCKPASSSGDWNLYSGTSDPDQDPEGAYGEIQDEMVGSHHPAQPADPVTMATSRRRLDADYDHIGRSEPKPSTSDVTYGHLARADDVTTDDYDHVGRARDNSRDVIDNTYDVAKAGSNVGNDATADYDVTSAMNKRQPDVINSPYDTLKTEW